MQVKRKTEIIFWVRVCWTNFVKKTDQEEEKFKQDREDDD